MILNPNLGPLAAETKLGRIKVKRGIGRMATSMEASRWPCADRVVASDRVVAVADRKPGLYSF
jgi:hypothetical protein